MRSPALSPPPRRGASGTASRKSATFRSVHQSATGALEARRLPDLRLRGAAWQSGAVLDPTGFRADCAPDRRSIFRKAGGEQVSLGIVSKFYIEAVPVHCCPGVGEQ